jgi:hypothetical protein
MVLRDSRSTLCDSSPMIHGMVMCVLDAGRIFSPLILRKEGTEDAGHDSLKKT